MMMESVYMQKCNRTMLKKSDENITEPIEEKRIGKK